MRTEIDYILAERLARLAGRFGAYGAKFVGLRLPLNQATNILIIRADPACVLGVLRSVLNEVGEEIAWPADAAGEFAVGAIVGTGRGGINPALVQGTIRGTAQGDAILTLSGHAKEGLVKQRGGEEAVGRAMAQLQARLSQNDVEFVVHPTTPPN